MMCGKTQLLVYQLEPGMSWIRNGVFFTIISVTDDKYRVQYNHNYDMLVPSMRITYLAVPTEKSRFRKKGAKIMSECNRYTEPDRIWIDEMRGGSISDILILG